jgi:hypothetical protein
MLLAVGSSWTVQSQEKARPPFALTGEEGCPSPAYEGKPRPEAWRVEENVYSNDFYGLRFEFPKGWFVDKAVMEHDANQKKQHASRPDPKDPTYGVWLDIQCNHLLLAVSRDPEIPGAGRPVGVPHIVLEVSDVVFPRDIKSAKEWLNSRRESLAETSEVVREPADYLFDGQLFSRMDVREALLPLTDRTGKVLSPGGIVYIAEIVGVRNGYWIEFDLTASSPEDLEDLFQTLNSLHFN